MGQTSIWFYFASAGFVVKCVMLLLFTASIVSWGMIISRWWYFRQAQHDIDAFQQHFWSGDDLTQIYTDLNARDFQPTGLAAVFVAGFGEFVRLRKQQATQTPDNMLRIKRQMTLTEAQELEQAESFLPFLASVASVSPYIGLLGTVWGIMTAFQALGQVQQATIAMVAPGIAEALVATAMGLFAAIPAVLAYNRYSHRLEKTRDRYDNFQTELLTILEQQ